MNSLLLGTPGRGQGRGVVAHRTMTRLADPPSPTATLAQGSRPAPVRLVVQQPALPKYRVPVFRELARRPGIDMTLFWGDHPLAPKEKGVIPDGFDGYFVPMRQLPLGREVMLWHQPQWQYATPASADVLLLSWDIHYLSLVPALLRAKASGVPTILWGHGYSKTGSRLRSWPRDKVAELATALLFYNHSAADTFIKRGWDRRRIYVAPN